MEKYLLIVFLVCTLNYAQSDKIIEIKTVAKTELDSLIKNRENKLLLINVWATWCIPCREEFPDLVQLSNKYKNELEILAISVDYKEDVETKIIPFLKNNKVEFPVYLNGFKKDEKLINYFNKDWNGAIPATFIYDKKGKQIEYIEGKHSFESFSNIIERFLY